ncbi:MAG: RNA 2',3'-cyclic phosphodiesterase [Candidatus Diapherotrites archaeon]|uniref:RNA 2',3'-cyclic phosphodiesterase n=1 Tax=Candidatus Iainarchaeum sp. TaxID=3101447 RepID=A0A8T4LF73_9ARCH|nr:RNA 2',3'-cyclic phosphodiesterase [Candidatus Diapherotrites archaeon]
MNDRARSFFAVNFSLDVQDEITRTLVSKIPSDGFGRTRVENLHLTLFFLGNISKEQVEQLKEKTLSLTQTNPFEIELNGIGHFKNNIIWLGTGKGTPEIQALATNLGDAIGIKPADFHAHITLARTKSASPRSVRETVEKLRSEKYSKKIFVRGFDLMQSTLTHQGPRYKVLFSICFEEPR